MAPTREAVRESSDRVPEAPKQKETRGRGGVSLREELIATASALRVGDHTNGRGSGQAREHVDPTTSVSATPGDPAPLRDAWMALLGPLAVRRVLGHDLR